MNGITKLVLTSYVVTSLGLPTLSCPLHASADTNFFHLSDKWNQRFKYLGEGKVKVPSVGFLAEEEIEPRIKGPAAKYFKEKDDVETARRIYQSPPPATVELATLRAAKSKIVEIKLNQVLTVQGRGIERYLATTPGVVEFFSSGSQLLQIKGASIGRTYVHIWDIEGRSTYQILVIQPPYVPTRAERKYAETLFGGESFKFGYTQNRSSFYQGDKFEDLRQTTLSFTQDFTLRGDTPYGYLDSGISLRRSETEQNNAEISEAAFHLEDAQMGPFRYFDLNLADDRIDPGLLIMPSVRIRGANVQFDDPRGRTDFTVFYGRELSSILGTLSPSLDENASVDSFLGGAVYDFQLSPAAGWGLAYIQAYGQERDDELNNNAVEFVQRYQLGEYVDLESHTGFDDAHFAQTTDLGLKVDWVDMNLKYRDISKRFFTMIGNPGDQGEQGLRFNMALRPSKSFEVMYDADVYRERLFPALGQRDRFNVEQRWDLGYYLSPRSSLSFQYENREDTALASPTRDQLLALSYTQGLNLLGRNMSYFTRIRDRDFESLSNPVLNYRSQGLNLGLQAPLWFGILFSFEQELSILEETELQQITHPRVSTYALAQSAQIGKTPFFADWSVRFRDEEETESDRAFLTGDDRLELSGSLRYRLDNMEFFVDGRFDTIFGESSDTEPHRAEGEVVTGIRYLFDTDRYWEASGAFRGYVFNDLNNDGIRQANEPGMPGIVVRVGEHRVKTDEEGYYETPKVSGKRAVIVLESDSVPTAHVPTTSFRKTVPVNQYDAPRVDFGLVTKSLIRGYIYNDVNENGRYDREDVGMGGVALVLDGEETRRSDPRGRYQFPDVVTGMHRVALKVETLPMGYLPQSVTQREVELFKGVSYELNFPVVAERTLSGRVFIDTNESGVMDQGDEAFAGAKVMLGSRSVVSDNEGYYLFSQVGPGAYRLAIDPASIKGYNSDFRETLDFGSDPKVSRIDLPIGKEE